MIASGAAGDGMVGGENSANAMDARNSTGNNYMEGHQGQYTAPVGFPEPTNIMFGGAGNDAMVAGSGYNEMHAGSGVDTFIIINSAINQVGGGNQIMLDSFKQGTDHLDLVSYGGATDALLATAGHANGGHPAAVGRRGAFERPGRQLDGQRHLAAGLRWQTRS